MPANLTADYVIAEKEFKAAQTPEEKLVCLKRMLATIPKHKGTEKLQADLKKRISQFKLTIDQQTKKKGPSHRIKSEGAGQIVLAGVPNAGKSALLKALSHAEPEVASYPFTTREPIPGMMPYVDIMIQLVDLPPLSTEHCEPFVFDNIRGADGILVVLDMVESDPEEDLKQIRSMLSEKRIDLIPPTSEPEERIDGVISLRSIILLNKCDQDEDGELQAMVRDILRVELPLYAVSAEDGTGLDDLRRQIFDLLHILRVYTKQPGKKPDLDAPFTIPIGGTVLELAEVVHKDFVASFSSARIWGSGKFDGQTVHRDHVLQDGDVVELHK